MVDLERVKVLAEAGRTISQIADELGVSKQRIHQVLKEHGIEYVRHHAAGGQRKKVPSMFDDEDHFRRLLEALCAVFRGSEGLVQALGPCGFKGEAAYIWHVIGVPSRATPEFVEAIAKLCGVDATLIRVGHWPPRGTCMECLGTGRTWMDGPGVIPRIRAPRPLKRLHVRETSGEEE